MVDRLKALIINLIEEGQLTYNDINEIKDIYWSQVTEKANLSLYPNSNRNKFNSWYKNWDPLHGKSVA